MRHLVTLHSLALCTVRTARHSGDNAIDRALLQFVSDAGGDVEQLRVGDMGRLYRPLPISTVRKWMAVAAWEADERLLVAARGDARTLLPRCAMVRTVDGSAVDLDDVRRHAIQREMESLENAGYRVVAMAHRELEARGAPVETASLDDGMTLLAWVALEDVSSRTPCRPWARSSEPASRCV
jgi:magnesium-transporting ATPase (P-type)